MADSDEATVLVVDDERDLAELFKAYLEPAYDVYVATSGSEALSLADDDVDVILLDRRMPAMSGDELLSELTERGVDAQVALVTGVEPDADIVDMPFDDYLTKPVSKSDILALVEVLLVRSTYDECCQRFFSLASKKLALEKAGNVDSAEYHELVERMTALREEINGTLETLSPEDNVVDGIPFET